MLGSWTIMISARDFVLKKNRACSSRWMATWRYGKPQKFWRYPHLAAALWGKNWKNSKRFISRRPAQNRLGTRPKIRPGGHDAGDAWCLRYSLLHQILAVQYQTVHPISAAVGELQISSGSPPRNAESRAYHGRTQQTTRSEDLSGSCWVTNNHWDLSKKNMGIWKATFTIWLWLT